MLTRVLLQENGKDREAKFERSSLVSQSHTNVRVDQGSQLRTNKSTIGVGARLKGHAMNALRPSTATIFGKLLDRE